MGTGQFISPIMDEHKFRGHLNSLRKRGEIICDFETNELWVGGTEDTVNFISGSQGRNITASAGTNTQIQLNKDLDLYDKDLGIWIYCADRSNLSAVTLLLSFGNTSYAKHCYASIHYEILKDGWNYVTVSPLEYALVNSVYSDLKNVKSIRIRLSAKAAGSVSITVDKFMSFKKVLDKGAILFTFDDGNSSIYNNARPCLDKYNYPATVFMVTDYVGTDLYMTLDNLKILKDLSWVIASHTHTHKKLTEQTEETIISELTTSQNYLLNNGFAPGHKYMAYPHGANNAIVRGLTKRYYWMGFTIYSKEFQGLAIRDQAYIPRRLMKNTSYTVTQIKELLDLISARKAVMVFYAHSIGDTGDFTVAEFEEIIDYVNTLGLHVLTVDDLARIYGFSY